MSNKDQSLHEDFFWPRTRYDHRARRPIVRAFPLSDSIGLGPRRLGVQAHASKNRGISPEVEEFCTLNGVDFARGEVNRGVPAAWNQIACRASGKVVFILYDDVRPIGSGWFDDVLSVFDLN